MIKAALFLVTLALAAVLVMQWRDWPRPLSPAGLSASDHGAATDRGTPADGQPTTPESPPTKETYAAVAERPLFRPQRKPEPPQSAEPAAAPEPTEAGSLEGVALSAILISPALTSAWVKDPNAPQLKRLRLGDEQAGWSLKAILADRVVFERQGETNELLLHDFSKMSASPPAAPAPPHPTPAARPNPAASRQPPPPQRQPQPPQRQPPKGAQAPGGAHAPPTSPPPKPNVRRPTPQRPQ